MFGCTPKEALDQPLALVQAIADYRAARLAVDSLNQGRKGAQALARNPGLMQVLTYMSRAQRGEPLERPLSKRAQAAEQQAILEAYGRPDVDQDDGS